MNCIVPIVVIAVLVIVAIVIVIVLIKKRKSKKYQPTDEGKSAVPLTDKEGAKEDEN